MSVFHDIVRGRSRISHLPEGVDPFAKVYVVHGMLEEPVQLFRVRSRAPNRRRNLVHTAAHNHVCAVVNLLIGFRVHACWTIGAGDE